MHFSVLSLTVTTTAQATVGGPPSGASPIEEPRWSQTFHKCTPQHLLDALARRGFVSKPVLRSCDAEGSGGGIIATDRVPHESANKP